MSDFKSKLPDFKELAAMGGKLFNGIKSAVGEIVEDYKKKREPATPNKTDEPAAKKTASKKPAEKTSKKA